MQRKIGAHVVGLATREYELGCVNPSEHILIKYTGQEFIIYYYVLELGDVLKIDISGLD